MRKIQALFLPFIFFPLTFGGCDKNQLGTLDSKGSPPTIIALNLTPDSIYIDNLVPSNGQYAISIIANAQVTDIDGPLDIGSVSVDVVRPDGAIAFSGIELGDDGVGPDSLRGDGLFSGTIAFSIVRSQAGEYGLAVHAIDRLGLMSNLLVGRLELAMRNSSPSISTFPSVRQFSPPGSDSTLLTIHVAASDSNGLADISSLIVRTLNAVDSSGHQLFDDGSLLHADLFPGDGIFSSSIWTIPIAGLQNLELEFVAYDRQGSSSNTVRKTLQNSAPRLLDVAVPDSIERPGSGEQLIAFTLTATDSDGLGDIDSAYFRNTSSTNPTNIIMYDDGNIVVHGDTVRGDGTYSRIVSIDATTSLGRKEFHFYVVDKSGASDSLVRFITIH